MGKRSSLYWKTFDKQLHQFLNEIEEYIPAIVFGMYDGFYMYAPSKELVGDNKYEYKHNLKNYVYYSETLDDGTVIRYSLDNYVVVTGLFEDENGKVNVYLLPFVKASQVKHFYEEEKIENLMIIN
mgnify:CR=1 FL=1